MPFSSRVGSKEARVPAVTGVVLLASVVKLWSPARRYSSFQSASVGLFAVPTMFVGSVTDAASVGAVISAVGGSPLGVGVAVAAPVPVAVAVAVAVGVGLGVVIAVGVAGRTGETRRMRGL